MPQGQKSHVCKLKLTKIMLQASLYCHFWKYWQNLILQGYYVIFCIENVNHFFTWIFIIFILDFFCESSNTIPKQYYSIVFNRNLYGKSVFVPIFILFNSYLYVMMKWITFLYKFLLFLYQIFFCESSNLVNNRHHTNIFNICSIWLFSIFLSQ
jgi:hypothetical protein